MFLAIEIGGTKLQMALGAGDGRLAALWRQAIEPARGAEGIRAQISQGLPAFLKDNEVRTSELQGAGIGFGGPVNAGAGRVITSHQITGWDNYPLAEWLGELVSAPVRLGNDADVAGLGEAVHGAGRGADPVFYVTVGSGLGGGLIQERRIQIGAGMGAAEIGHLRLGPDGETLEHAASGWGIQEQFRKRRAGGEYSTLAPDEMLSVQNIGEAATAGDALAGDVLSQAVRDLAWGLCQMIAIVCPQKIVIGGGVSLLGEALFFTPLRSEVARQVFRPFAGLSEIVPAELGEEVVLHGAIELAKTRD